MGWEPRQWGSLSVPWLPRPRLEIVTGLLQSSHLSSPYSGVPTCPHLTAGFSASMLLTLGAGSSLVAQSVKNLPAMWETQVPSLDQEDPLEEGMANPLQYSGLQKYMDRGVWRATVHGFVKSWTQLSNSYLLMFCAVGAALCGVGC